MKIRSLFLLSLLLLFSSCSNGDFSALVSQSEATVYLSDNGKLAMIDVSKEDLDYLKEISGLDSEAVIEDLFDLDAVLISDEDYERRKEHLNLLLSQTGSEELLDALARYGKDLRKTDFMDTINKLSGAFDDEALLSAIMKAERLGSYSLGRVLSYDIRAYDDVRSFVRVWTEEVMR